MTVSCQVHLILQKYDGINVGIFYEKFCKICHDRSHKIIARACLKNHSHNLHAPLCDIFCPNLVSVTRYDALIRTKSPINCDAHLVESIFKHILGIPISYVRCNSEFWQE